VQARCIAAGTSQWEVKSEGTWFIWPNTGDNGRLLWNKYLTVRLLWIWRMCWPAVWLLSATFAGVHLCLLCCYSRETWLWYSGAFLHCVLMQSSKIISEFICTVLRGVGGGGGMGVAQCFYRCPVDLIFVSYKSSIIGQCHIKYNTFLRWESKTNKKHFPVKIYEMTCFSLIAIIRDHSNAIGRVQDHYELKCKI
jgi:hypothetical protein